MSVDRAGGALHITLSGELDHHAAKEIIKKMDSVTTAPLPAVCSLDMGGVGFMDSSGIAVVLGLYRRLSETDSRIVVKNVQPQAMRVFNAAGVDRLLTFE